MTVNSLRLANSFCNAIRAAYEHPSKSKIVVLNSKSGSYAAIPKPRFGSYSNGDQPVDIQSLKIDPTNLSKSFETLSDEDLTTLVAAFEHFGREDLATAAKECQELRELEIELEYEALLRDDVTTNSPSSSPGTIHPHPFLDVLDSKITTYGLTLDELTAGEKQSIESYITSYYNQPIDMEWGEEYVCVEDPKTSELFLFSYQELVDR